jgi:hypothetical protein
VRTLEELGAGGLTTQHEVVDAAGAFVGRIDVADPRIRCGLEYDGVQAHSPRAWGRDEGRYERLRAAGWTIDTITKLDLLPGEPRLRRIVERWASRRAA